MRKEEENERLRKKREEKRRDEGLRRLWTKTVTNQVIGLAIGIVVFPNILFSRASANRACCTRKTTLSKQPDGAE